MCIKSRFSPVSVASISPDGSGTTFSPAEDIKNYSCFAVSAVGEMSVVLLTRLSLAELQHLGESLSLGRRQILLRLELLLQLDGLVVGEANLSAFPLVQGPLDERGPQQRFTCRTDGTDT